MSELALQADFNQIARPFKAKPFKPTTKRYKNSKALLADEKKRLEAAQVSVEKPTYHSVKAPPTLKPTKKWCDITGLPAKYKTPTLGIRYHDKEVFGVVNTLGGSVEQQYLELRGAHVQLK